MSTKTNKKPLTVAVETMTAINDRSSTLIPQLTENVTKVAKAELGVDKAEIKADEQRNVTGALLDEFYRENPDIMPAVFCAKPSSRKASGCIEKAAENGFHYDEAGYALGMGIYNSIYNTFMESGVKNVSSSVQNLTQKNSAWSVGSSSQTDSALERAIAFELAPKDALEVRKQEQAMKKDIAKAERKQREAKAESSKTNCLEFLQGELIALRSNFMELNVIERQKTQRALGAELLEELINTLNELRNS
tara:strand:- start:20 stop:766 length:747 start_codon:yes stop_codon:yes gene_type:complete